MSLIDATVNATAAATDQTEWKLLEKEEPHYLSIYSLSVTQNKKLWEYIPKNLAKGYIWPSKSPVRYLILFISKKDDTLRIYINYQKLNDITIKNQYPLPLIEQICIIIQKAQIFMKLDIYKIYHRIRIKEGDE